MISHRTYLKVLLQDDKLDERTRLGRVLADEYISPYAKNLFALWCAEETLSLMGNADPRSVKALSVKRLWLDGEATDQECDDAWAGARAVCEGCHSYYSMEVALAAAAVSRRVEIRSIIETALELTSLMAEMAAHHRIETLNTMVPEPADPRLVSPPESSWSVRAETYRQQIRKLQELLDFPQN